MGDHVSARESMGTQSVERALGLLEAFTDEYPERRISELVSISGLGQSTVSRLVGTLDALGFLERDSRAGLYRIGPRAITLGALALNSEPIYGASRQIAQAQAAETGLGVNVATRRGANLFYLCHFEGPLAPKNFDMAGRRGSLHATGLGKALLSDVGTEQLGPLLGDALPRMTPHTIGTLGELAAALTEVRRTGYSVEREELAFGRACVAAPIRDRSSQIVAAISISGSVSAMDLDARLPELASRVIEMADQISIGLGYRSTVIAASMA